MPLDPLISEYADALFKQRRREIYDQEESELEAIRKASIHNGMIHTPQYLIDVGKYLVKRTSKLADAKIETLLAAVKRARILFTDEVLGEVTSIVLDFCNKQQHQEIRFLAKHIEETAGLNNVSKELNTAVVERIQIGISGVMDAVKDRMTSTRLETLLDARNNQAVYASGLGKQWDVFISHASEDKEGFVEPLAKALQLSGLKVWYDKTALTVGDRLRQKIDEGLAQSRYGIVVLSHSFFAKQWPKDELEGLFAREIAGVPGLKVILPVWHSINAWEVAQYSPMLAGRFAANSNDALDVVVRQLRDAMGIPSDENILPVSSFAAPKMHPVAMQLSEEARQLLLEGSRDRDGRIMWLSMAEGLQIQTNGKAFIESQNARSEAKWEAAIQQLEQRGLIQRESSSIFSLTDKGFKVADTLS